MPVRISLSLPFLTVVATAGSLGLVGTLAAQQGSVAPAAGMLAKGAETNLSPMFSAAVETLDAAGKPQSLALRGLMVKSGDGWVCYDTGAGGVAAIWAKPTLDFHKTNLATYKGLESGAVIVSGETKPLPPVEKGRWKGCYLHGDRVIAAVERSGKLTYELIDATPRALMEKEAIEWTRGGPARWPESIEVEITRAKDDAPYVVDRIPLPDENPWKSWMRPTGLDFFPDGRIAIATLGGDVWISSPIEEKTTAVKWRRYAVGLREPMGLRIAGGKIVVGCRDQITRLHDLNNDGEADFYECVNAGRELVPNFHAFAYDLQTDRAGNFYFSTGGNQLGPDEPWHGPLFRVTPDGNRIEPIARGFRAPNGVTIGPDDSVYVAENQGQWIPSSKISLVKAGGFYGFVADPKAAPKAKAPEAFDPPICYIPMAWDNSSGGGVFCEGEQWGPYRGKMLHTSFGAAALFAILEQRAGDKAQAAVVKFPSVGFESGVDRARFNPKDGQLYACGVKGWQSRAVRDGCLARVRYTGAPVTTPTGWRAEKDAIVIEFSTPLDRVAAEDSQNYAGEQWNYLWHATYGSPDVSPSNPKKRGRDTVDIQTAKLSADGKTLTLGIPGLQPVMQMVIKGNLKTADGKEFPLEIAQTLNWIP